MTDLHGLRDQIHKYKQREADKQLLRDALICVYQTQGEELWTLLAEIIEAKGPQ